jgi:hypothetical protein
MEIYLSNSMTKSMGIYVCDDEIISTGRYCPADVKARYIDGLESGSSEIMNKGKFFETKCLGSGRAGEKTETLPRLKNGKKSTDEIRLIDRSHDFKKLCAQRFINVNEYNTQMPLVAHYGEVTYGDYLFNVYLKGELDLFPTIVDGERLAIIDLKLTTSAESDYFSNSYPENTANSCWGLNDGAYIAKNQPLIYHHLVRNIDMDLLLEKARDAETAEKYMAVLTEQVIRMSQNATFEFLVFDKRPETPGRKNMTVVRYDWNERREELLDKLIDEAVYIYADCVRTEWEQRPNEISCKRCGIQCSMSNQKISFNEL